MGKIKSKLVRRSANNLIKNNIKFSENFEKNKEILGNTMPSKKLRNQIAGLLAKLEQKNSSKTERFQIKNPEKDSTK